MTLFERVGRSLSLTRSGLELLDHVRMMGDAAGRMSLTASGHSQTIEGQVCISASDTMAAYYLPPRLKRLREFAPGIEIEVVASNTLSDLRRREADIAIRHVRPEQPDLIAKFVRESSAHLYAATAWLDAHGRPQDPADLTDAVFIGFEHSERLVHRLNAQGLPLAKSNFKLISQSGIVYWEMVKQGLGVGVMMKDVAELAPAVECVLPELEPIPVPIWLATHRELHTSRRIRLVFDFLADALA